MFFFFFFSITTSYEWKLAQKACLYIKSVQTIKIWQGEQCFKKICDMSGVLWIKQMQYWQKKRFQRSSDCKSLLTLWFEPHAPSLPPYFTLWLRQEGGKKSGFEHSKATGSGGQLRRGEEEIHHINTQSVDWVRKRHYSPVNHLGSMLGMGGGVMCWSLFHSAWCFFSVNNTCEKKHLCTGRKLLTNTSQSDADCCGCQTTSSLSYNTEDARVT